MSAPMVVIELLLMSSMYDSKKLNLYSSQGVSGGLCPLPVHQAAGRDFGSPVLEVDDPAPLGSDSDV
jgi:hypothetical protein